MAAPEKGMSVISFIQHYQRSILKSQEDETRLLHCLEKLHGLHVQVSHLQVTGVGRTVNALRKRPGPVGEAARKLVATWKQIVEAHVSSEDEAVPSSTQAGDERTSCDTVSSSNHKRHRHEDMERSQRRSPTSSDRHSSVQKPQSSRHGSPSLNSKNGRHRSSDVNSNKHRNPESNGKISRDSSPEPVSSQRSTESSSRHDPLEHHSPSKDRKHRSPSKESKHHSPGKESKHRSPSKELKHRSPSRDSKHHSPSRDSKHSSPSKDGKHHSSSKESKHRSPSKERKHHSPSKERKHRSPSKPSEYSSKHRSPESKVRHGSPSSKHRHESRDKKVKSREERSSESPHKPKKPVDLKREPEEYKPKKVKVEEPPPLMFDFVKPKIKEEPAYDSDEPTEPLDLPVPKFESSVKVKVEENGDSPVGASFEEALGFIDFSPTKPKSKRDRKRKNVPSTSNNCDYSKPLPRSEELAAILDLPSPNYRPLPQVPVRQQRAPMSEHDALTAVITNKGQRTKVYSGVKSFQGEVPSLQDMCIRILQENIDALEYIGWAPFYLMEPVLSRASAPQLANIERHNPRLSEDTDELWHALVTCEFRAAGRQEGECWRDVYERSLEEREDKLGSLKAKIKRNNEARKAPQRTTKLAYVNSHVKPPRSVLRQQAKHGTASGSLPAPRPKPGPGEEQAGPSGQSSHASTLARTVGMLREGPSMSIKSKKRPAPLMQKTLKLLKTSFRR